MAKNLNRSKSKSATSILIIYTGGTIGMMQDFKSGVLKPINFNQIKVEVPEIRKFNYKIDVVSFKPVLDSSDMQPRHWVKMAEIIEKNYDKYTGFVILHGSDTLAFTASALSFMLENLAKPVIITGSQLPVGEVRTDAKENLITSIEIAASTIKGKAVVPEVCVYFDYRLFRGNRTSKVNASSFEAFNSVNFPPLGEAGVYLNYNTHLILPASGKKLKVHKSLDSEVSVVRIYPGMGREWFRASLNAGGVKAIVLETFGSGNAPSDDWFIDELRSVIRQGKIVVNISQCHGGMVKQGVYATSSGLAAAGVIGGGDLTTETALTKLMFLLGNKSKVSDIKKLMVSSLRGELSL